MVRLANILRRDLRGQDTRILNLNAIIVDGDAYGQVIPLILTMAESIQDGFTQGFSRHFQLLIPNQSDNLPVHIKVLAEEIHRLIEQHKDVSLHSLVIDKLILISSLETG